MCAAISMVLISGGTFNRELRPDVTFLFIEWSHAVTCFCLRLLPSLKAVSRCARTRRHFHPSLLLVHLTVSRYRYNFAVLSGVLVINSPAAYTFLVAESFLNYTLVVADGAQRLAPNFSGLIRLALDMLTYGYLLSLLFGSTNPISVVLNS